MSGPLAAFWGYAGLAHKVDFDPLLKLITIAPEVSSINVQEELYSASKEWLLLTPNMQYRPPMRSVGGDLLPSGLPLGRTFFLTNGWRIQLDHAVTIAGNLYSDDFDSPYVVQRGVQLSSSQVSNLVDTVTTTETVQVVTSVPTPSQIWQHPVEGLITAEEAMRLFAAALAGKLSGAAGTTITMRDVNDTKDRIVATVDEDGNRTAVNVDVT